MLVLSRKVGESIDVGGNIITVVKIVGDKVRIGIDADAKVPIRRSELPPRPQPCVDEMLGHVLAAGPDDAHDQEAAATTRRSA